MYTFLLYQWQAVETAFFLMIFCILGQQKLVGSSLEPFYTLLQARLRGSKQHIAIGGWRDSNPGPRGQKPQALLLDQRTPHDDSNDKIVYQQCLAY